MKDYELYIARIDGRKVVHFWKGKRSNADGIEETSVRQAQELGEKIMKRSATYVTERAQPRIAQSEQQ